MHPTPDKAALRTRLRKLRAAVPARQQRVAARALLRGALHHRLLARSRRIGFYIPAKAEIDVLPLINQALHMGVACYLPVVPGRGLRKLWFVRLGGQPTWALNRYGIPEYHPPHPRRVRAQALDTVFLPMLGFDGEGYRVGMGGGYYDATLAFLAHRRRWRRPALIGMAYAAQEVEYAPRDTWDIPLDAALTEAGLRRFLRRPSCQ